MDPKPTGFVSEKQPLLPYKNTLQNFSIAKQPNEAQLFLSIYNYYTQDHAQK